MGQTHHEGNTTTVRWVFAADLKTVPALHLDWAEVTVPRDLPEKSHFFLRTSALSELLQAAQRFLSPAKVFSWAIVGSNVCS